MLRTPEEISAWYRGGGDAAAAAEMEQLLRELVPRLSPLAVLSDACANCTTPTGQAYVGAVAPGLAVATGGNGLAAKSSDELGRLAAHAALSEAGWDAATPLPAERLAPRLQTATSRL